MDSRLLKQFRQIFNKEKVKSDKRIIIFLFFLLASIIFWLLQVLSNDYTTTISYPVSYTKFPKNKVLLNKLPAHLTLKVNAYGFTLLRYTLNPAINPITIDVNSFIANKASPDDGLKFYILTRDYRERISRQISSEIKVIDILPDTIMFLFTDIISKKVIVKPNIKLDFEKQYKLTGKLQVKPGSVTISGPGSILDTIDFVLTEFHHLTDMNKTTGIDLAVKNIKGVKISERSIFLTIPVEKFTEGSLVIPIEVKNLPDTLQLSTFPNEVTVSYLIGLTDYDKVESSDFKAVVDFRSTSNNLSNKLRVRIVKYPSNINSMKFHPKSVEYIVKK